MNPPVLTVPAAQRPTLADMQPFFTYLATQMYQLREHGSSVTFHISRRMNSGIDGPGWHDIRIEPVRPVLVTTSDTIRATFTTLP